MALQLVFETHQPTEDNEAGIATGWLPGRLSAFGRSQAAELGERRRDDGLTAVFSSDLTRATETVDVVARDLRPHRRACPGRGDWECQLVAGVHATTAAGCSTATSRRGSPSTSSSPRTTRARSSRARTPIPFVRGDDALPDNGWDFVIRNGLLASLRGQEPDAISAVEIAVRPDRQGTGLSGQMLARCATILRGWLRRAVAPVRPDGKADVHEPMSTYACRVLDDGLPVDPWVGCTCWSLAASRRCPRSMVIPGTLEDGAVTGSPFDETGPDDLPQALAPVHGTSSTTRDVRRANVWVVHRTGT